MLEPPETPAGEPRGVSIELRNLTKRFSTVDGERIALDGFDLEARPGEFIAVIGQSGCGKSTAFNIAAGLDGADHPAMFWIDGAVGRSTGSELSAYMPQRDGLLAVAHRSSTTPRLPLELARGRPRRTTRESRSGR